MSSLTRTIAGAAAVAAVLAAAPAASAAELPGVTGAVPGVTDAALAAGKALHGADATIQQSLEAYWTPERMAAARPAASDAAVKAAMDRYSARATGAPALPKVGLPQLDLASPGGQGGSEGQGTTAAYNPNLPTGHPTARTNGKIFFSKPGQGGYVCSGTIINTAGADQVWTAGHCLHGGAGAGWHTNVVFVPNYDDDLSNPRPYGTWAASGLWALTSWTNSSDFGDDIGVANMHMQYGYHIREYFGGQGFRVNAGLGQWENAMGYPSENPFDGGNLQRCWGTNYAESGNTYRIPCDLTRGSSGGPHLDDYDGNWGYLNGVNSRIDRIYQPTWMASPYFDNSTLILWNHTKDM